MKKELAGLINVLDPLLPTIL